MILVSQRTPGCKGRSVSRCLCSQSGSSQCEYEHWRERPGGPWCREWEGPWDQPCNFNIIIIYEVYILKFNYSQKVFPLGFDNCDDDHSNTNCISFIP